MVEDTPLLVRLEQHVTAYLRQNDNVGYNRFEDFEWDTLKDSVVDSGMKDVHIGAVETAMLVEDHIPGYGSEYMRLFMVTPDRTDEEARMCRQMLHFVFRWVMEEDRHAHCLELWLRNSGKRDPQALTDLMVLECKKTYQVPHENPLQLFTYTACQEKATQLYYKCLRDSVQEPVLRAVLVKLMQDEARHCHFFSQLVLDGLQDATSRHVAQMKEVLEGFSMPLAMMLENYKRKAIQMLENYKRKAIQMRRAAGGYDHTEAFDHFARLVKRTIDARTNSRGTNLQDLLLFTQSLLPAQKTAKS